MPVLIAASGHQRLTERWPAARAAPAIALGVVALGLSAHAYYYFYRHQTVTVHTAHGSYRALDAAGPAIQRTVDYVRAHSPPGSRLVALPDDPGLYFMTDRRPALNHVVIFPRFLETGADERGQIARLRAARAPLYVQGARRFDNFDFTGFGVDFNVALGEALNRLYRPVATFGDYAHPNPDGRPSEAFRVYVLRDGSR